MLTFVEALVVVLCLHRAPTCADDARPYAELVAETASANGLDPVRVAGVLLEVRRGALPPATVERITRRLNRWWHLCGSWNGALRGHYYHTGCRAPDLHNRVHTARRRERQVRRALAD